MKNGNKVVCKSFATNGCRAANEVSIRAQDVGEMNVVDNIGRL